MSHVPAWTGDESDRTVLTMINNNNSGRGHYGSLPPSAARHDSPAKNGPPRETAFRYETSGLADFGNPQELYKKEIDWAVVSSTGRILMIAAAFALLLAIGVVIGASIAASVSLFVIAACILTVFSRQVFLLFLLSVAGVSTIRATYYKQRKFQLLISICAILLAFTILGGTLYSAIHRLIANDYYKVHRTAFLTTCAVSLPFIAILCGLLSMARKLEDQRNTRSRSRTPKAKAAHQKAAVVSGFSRFSKERGLILRRTLNRISIRSNHYLSLVLLLQALAAFIAALIAYFKPHTLISDAIIALLFTPLAVIMTISLVWDIISVMTEGILQGVDFGEIAEALISIDGVTAVRHLRIWSMKTDEVSLSVQIAIDDQANFDTVLKNANELLKTKYDIYQYKIDSAVGDLDKDSDIDV